jgi:hypothetical protein
MAQAKEVKQMKTTAVGKDVISEPEYDNGIGDIIENELSSIEYADALKIPLGYIRKATVNGEDVEVSLRYSVPPEIKPDEYYAVCEWRIGSEDLDNADNWPQWKRLPLIIDGQTAMREGRAVMVSYYVIVSVQDVPETNPHERQSPFRDFHIDAPFSDNKIQMSDFGLPVIKGSDIIAVAEAKKVLAGNPGFGATRRRGQDTSGGAV